MMDAPIGRVDTVERGFQLLIDEFRANILGHISPEVQYGTPHAYGLAKGTRLGFARRHRLGSLFSNLCWRYSLQRLQELQIL